MCGGWLNTDAESRAQTRRIRSPGRLHHADQDNTGLGTGIVQQAAMVVDGTKTLLHEEYIMWNVVFDQPENMICFGEVIGYLVDQKDD